MIGSRQTTKFGLWPAVVVALVIIGLGFGISYLDAFPEIREYTGKSSIPKILVRSGRTGKELRLLEYKSLAGMRLGGFDKSLQAKEMPSTTILDARQLQRGIPILSIVIDSNDLLNRDSGLIANFDKRGRGWERPAYASFFRDGRLQFATGAGLRVHGGKSRARQQKSYRLYFRELYGASSAPRELIVGGPEGPIHSLVIRNEASEVAVGESIVDWQYINPIAYDISARIGCITPNLQPVELFINGVDQGPYVLMEHMTNDYLTARFGHSNFVFADTKSDDGSSMLKKGDQKELNELIEWPLDAPAPLRMSEVERRIDLENLTNWFISILYTGTTDPFQGIVARETGVANARWFWMNWDMDHSFIDVYDQVAQPWDIDNFTGRSAIVRDEDPRAVIFNRLRLESPEFRRQFVSRLVEVLNHELDHRFMNELIERYDRTAGAFGIRGRDFLQSLSEYAKHRPAVLRQQMGRYFQSGPSFLLTVNAPPSLGVKVDGHTIDERYEGWYFKDSPAFVEIEHDDFARKSILTVNGAVLESGTRRVALSLTSDTVIDVRLKE